MDDDGVIALEVQDADLKKRPITRRSDEHRQILSSAIRRTALRTACQMSASGTPCFRAGSPMRT